MIVNRGSHRTVETMSTEAKSPLRVRRWAYQNTRADGKCCRVISYRGHRREAEEEDPKAEASQKMDAAKSLGGARPQGQTPIAPGYPRLPPKSKRSYFREYVLHEWRVAKRTSVEHIWIGPRPCSLEHRRCICKDDTAIGLLHRCVCALCSGMGNKCSTGGDV